MIIVENLTKTFKNKKNSKIAVNDISFTAKRGGFWTIRSQWSRQNNCSKNNCHLVTSRCGQVKVDNLNVLNQSRAVRNKIGFLTSEMRLSGRLTPREFPSLFWSFKPY